MKSIIILLSIIIASCSAASQLRRAASLTNRAILSGASVKADTIYQSKPLTIEGRAASFVLPRVIRDTIIVRESNRIKIKTVIKNDTIFQRVNCPDTTAVIKSTTSITNTITAPRQWLSIAVAFALGIALVLAVMLLSRRIITALVVFVAASSIALSQTSPDTIRVVKPCFTVLYSQTLHCPIEVIYTIANPRHLYDRTRMDFYREPKLPTAQNIDFIGNVWDRGHMLSAESASYDSACLTASFSYINVAPQHEHLNRVTWLELERLERKLAYTDSVSITIRVIFSPKPQRLRTGTAVPIAFEKQLLLHKTKSRMLYRFPNAPCTLPLSAYRLNDYYHKK